jgi:hypothetical protein
VKKPQRRVTYPDNPNAAVTALRDTLFRLFKARRFDAAADHALALTEAATRFSPVETIADRIARKRPADAVTLYAAALENARWIASGATSGAEGMVHMTDVRRLEKKLAARRKRA